MKKILKILIIPVIILIIILIYTIYLVNNNRNYLNNITKDIKANYPLTEEITYSNKYNNYYIFTTKTKVIVLNNEYTEILKENISNIITPPKNQKLIYKTNKLMYEETILKEDKLIYKYYDATNGEFIKETVLERN